MTTSAEILVDGFERVRSTATTAARGLSDELLEARVDPDANTIAWLVWHLTRGQDAQVADAAGTEQVWLTHGWSEKFALALPDDSTGYAHSSSDVAAVSGMGSDLLIEYLAAVSDRTVEYVGALSDDDLDRVVDTRWTPPVTLAVRLMSVISDDLQHAGQAAIIRGVLERSR
jgi:hypothetical protein